MSNAEKVERLRAKAKALHAALQLDEAEHLYRGILELHRTDLEARHMIGVLRLQQGRAAEALAILETLVLEAPDHADIRAQCGLARQDLGRRDEALADFDSALALKPGNVLSLLYRGNLLREAGLFAQALESYDRLLQVVPGFDEAWFCRGLTLPVTPRRWNAIPAALVLPSTVAPCCSSSNAMTKPLPLLKKRAQ